jgi:catechol 2,3-dioxygenase-like lactoylglutathione lyase family enzyme
MIQQIHHVAILTQDIDTSIKHYVDLLGCEKAEPMDVIKPGLRWRSVLLPIGNGTTALQLIQPLEGPGVEELARSGEGTLFEIGFACEDAEAFGEHLQERAVKPADLTEQALEEKYLQSKYGNRFFIVPRKKSRGTRLEFVQFSNK